MSVLAIDTCANICAAVVFDRQARPLSHVREDIGRGHAAHLLPIVEHALAGASLNFADLTKTIVAIGPGSFTGIRVGVSAARGYGVALSIPVEGFSTFALLVAQARTKIGEKDMLVSIKGGRGQLFNQRFSADGKVTGAPFIWHSDSQDRPTVHAETCLVGNGAAILDPDGKHAHTLGDRATGDLDFAPGALAIETRAPEPLYIRDADAKPQSGFALPRKMENT